jgi:hypothetical protein
LITYTLTCRESLIHNEWTLIKATDAPNAEPDRWKGMNMSADEAQWWAERECLGLTGLDELEWTKVGDSPERWLSIQPDPGAARYITR